jgi:hypothetical protein
MIDVKKLITGFLILATAAVCSGLIFAFTNFTPSTAANTASADGITINGVAPTNSGSAFIPTEAQVQEVAAALAPDLASSTMLVSSTDPNNLTDQLATDFVNGVVAANPNGPTGTDTNGNPTFNPPDVTALAASIADTTSTQDLPIPDWDVEAESVPIAIIATSSGAALMNYGNALNDIMNSHLDTNAQVQSIVGDTSGSADASDLSFVGAQVESALQDASALQVPTPAVAYQKSLITDLVYEKNLIQLNTLAQTDPVKASLLFQQEDNRFYAVQTNFLDQAQSLTSKTLSLQKPAPNISGMILSFINNTFSISQANAQLVVDEPVLDAITIPYDNANQTLDLTSHAQQVASSASLFSLISSIHVQNLGQRLEALLQNTLLQILKNTLVAIIQREVLTWIQGSGAPRFITNWGTQLVNAAQASALNSINTLFDQNGCTFPAFIGQEKITLNAFYKPGSNVCANQFAAALGANSFQQFYNNFANGGFIAFGASTLPSGNSYGNLFFNAQTVAFSYKNQQGASQLKAQSSNGLTGNQVCSDGSDPNGTHVECESNTANDYVQPAAGFCSQGYTAVVEDNNGLCANGNQPQVTTPAAATGFVLGSAIDATPKQLSAANDIVGVLNAVLNSLLTGLASTAVNAAGQLVNQGLTSLNSSNITAGATPPPTNLQNLASTTSGTAGNVASIPLACNPSSQTIPSTTAGTGGYTPQETSSTSPSAATTNSSPTSISATGGTTDVDGNPPTYYWIDSNGVSGTGAFFNDTFAAPGTYTITLTDSASDTPAICTVTVQQ